MLSVASVKRRMSPTNYFSYCGSDTVLVKQHLLALMFDTCSVQNHNRWVKNGVVCSEEERRRERGEERRETEGEVEERREKSERRRTQTAKRGSQEEEGSREKRRYRL